MSFSVGESGAVRLRDALSGRERIREAMAHKEADRVPVFDVVNNPSVYRELLGAENTFSDGPSAVRLARELGLDAVMVPAGCYTGLIKKENEWVSKDTFRDRFGALHRVMESSWPLGVAVGEVPLDAAFADAFGGMAVVSPEDLRAVREAVAAAHSSGKDGEDEIALFAGLRSAFSHLYITGGIVALSMLIYEDPDLLHRLVRLSTDFWTEVGLRAIEAGADALYVANDMGMNGSTLISPDHLREFFLPAFREQCAVWKQAGGRVILHSCGNIEAILPDLACMEIGGLNNLQSHAGMDIGRVKSQYGGKWTLFGNVDATEVMTSHDPERIEKAVLQVLSVAGHGGGLVIATDHSFHKGIPLENVRHFIHCAKQHGRYPLRLPAEDLSSGASAGSSSGIPPEQDPRS